MPIRQVRPEDHAEIDKLLTAAFGGTEEVALVAALRSDGAVQAELVEEDSAGAIAGHAMTSRMAGPEGWVALAPVATLPGFERRGIASGLIRALLGEARDSGARAAVVLGDPEFYGRFGFSVAAAARMSSPYPIAYTGVRILNGGPLTEAEAIAELRYAPAFAAV